MLIHAAAESSHRSLLRGAASVCRLLALAGLLAGLPGAVLADDEVEPSEPAQVVERDDDCPALVRQSHPFLCEDAEPNVPVTATWENSRRMPRQGDWVESEGTWGPSLHVDWH